MSSAANFLYAASTPGLSFPPDLTLNAYTKPRTPNTSSTGKSPVTTSEHILHTPAHPRIDYTGREEEGGGTDGLLSHYIGVYDPQSGDLQLMRARKLVLRGSPRSIPTEVEQETKAATVSCAISIHPSTKLKKTGTGSCSTLYPRINLRHEKVQTRYPKHDEKCHLPVQEKGSCRGRISTLPRSRRRRRHIFHGHRRSNRHFPRRSPSRH